MRHVLLVCLFFIAYTASFSESFRTIDSLKAILENVQENRLRQEIYCQIAKESLYINNEEALIYGIKSLELAQELEDTDAMSKAYLIIARHYNSQSNHVKALSYLFKLLVIVEDNNNDLDIGIASNLIGTIYYQQGNRNQALFYYEKALNVFKDVDSINYLPGLYNNLGEFYADINEFDKAFEYFNKSVELGKKNENYADVAISYNNIGCLYFRDLNDKIGIDYLNKALFYSEMTMDSIASALVYNSIGDYYLWQKEYDKAYLNLSYALGIAQRNNILIRERNVVRSMSHLFNMKGDYKKAYEYHLRFKVYNDSLFNDENTRKLTQLEMQHKFDKQDREKTIELLEKDKEIKIQRLAFLLSLISFLFIGGFIYSLYRNKSKQSRLKWENLKLEQKLLKEELEYKNKEIATKVMNLINKNELIANIMDQLQGRKDRFKKENQVIIEEIIQKLNSNVNKEIWKEFEYRFKEVHSDFYKNLGAAFPTLTTNELKLCAFLRLNMSTKDISAITHQSANSIEVARTRLRKKLELSNKDTSLVTFLSQF